MAERDQLMGPLGGHDAGDPRRGDDVALLGVPARIASSVAGRMVTVPSATATRLVTALSDDIDHAGGAGLVEVGEASPWPSAEVRPRP